MSFDPTDQAHHRPACRDRDPVSQLECEWLALEPAAIAAALHRWHARQPSLRRFTSGRRLLSFLNTASPEQTDTPLLALLLVAGTDQLAGRLVLQAILPALKSQAQRIAHDPARRDEVWELLLFFAWEAICNYPLERRRFRVAANLVLQVLHDTTRELRQPTMQPEPSSPTATSTSNRTPARVQQPDGSPTTAEALLETAVAAGVIATRDAQLILQTRVDGIRLRLIARTEGIAYDALLKRRQRAEAALRHTHTVRADVRKTCALDLNSDAVFVSASRRSLKHALPERAAASRNAA